MQQRPCDATTVTPDASVADVLEALEQADVGAVVVSPDGAAIAGIVSERDIVRGLRVFGSNILGVNVRELMTSDVVTCELRDPAIGVMAKMDAMNIRHVPVVENGKLAGMVSIKDIVSDRLRDVEDEVNSLSSYISGSH